MQAYVGFVGLVNVGVIRFHPPVSRMVYTCMELINTVAATLRP